MNENNENNNQIPTNDINSIITTYSTKTYKDENSKPSFMKGIDTMKNNGYDFIDIDNYYNFYGVMTPKVDISFRDTNNNWVDIDTFNNKKNFNNNYFVSAVVEDNGARKISLTLFDRSFYNLQYLIFNAIKSAGATTSFDKSVVDSNSRTQDLTIKDNYGNNTNTTLRFKIVPESIKNNLKVRWGYTDANPSSSATTILTNPNYYSNMGGNKDKNVGRWNDRATENSVVVNESGGNFITKGGYEDVFSQINQTTIRSQEEEFFITDVKSTLTSTGMQYVINGVGTDSFVLNSYKFVQMYATMKGTSKDLMAYFMNSFNKSEDSLIKVCWNDDVDIVNGNEYVKDFLTGAYTENTKNKANEEITKAESNLAMLNKRKEILSNTLACIKLNEGNTISENLGGINIEYTKTMNMSDYDLLEIKQSDLLFNALAWDDKLKDYEKNKKKYAMLVGLASESPDLYLRYKGRKDAYLKKAEMKIIYLAGIYASGNNINLDQSIKKVSLVKGQEINNNIKESYEKFAKDIMFLEDAINEINIEASMDSKSQKFIGNDREIKKYYENAGFISSGGVLDVAENMFSELNKFLSTGDDHFLVKKDLKAATSKMNFLRKALDSTNLNNSIDTCTYLTLMNQLVSSDRMSNWQPNTQYVIAEGYSLADYTSILFRKIEDIHYAGGVFEETDKSFLLNNLVSIIGKSNDFNGYDHIIAELENISNNEFFNNMFRKTTNKDKIIYNIKQCFNLIKAIKNFLIYSSGEQEGIYIEGSLQKLTTGYFLFDGTSLQESVDGKLIGEISEELFPFENSPMISYRRSFFYAKTEEEGSAPSIAVPWYYIINLQYSKDLPAIEQLFNTGFDILQYYNLDKVEPALKFISEKYDYWFNEALKHQNKKTKKENSENNGKLLENFLMQDIENKSDENSIKPKYNDPDYIEDLNKVLGVWESISKSKYLNIGNEISDHEFSIRKRLSNLEPLLEEAEKNLAFTKEQYLEKGIIKLSLGGEEAKANYDASSGFVKQDAKYYKSLSSLFNSYVGQCSPYVVYRETNVGDNKKGFLESEGDGTTTYNTTDENGDTVTVKTEGVSSSRRMTWNVVGKDTKGTPIVAFHYLRPFVPNHIRWYSWGTGNPLQHCVKNVNIETTSEFGMLNSAIIKDSNSGSTVLINSNGDKQEADDFFTNKGFINGVVDDSTSKEHLVDAMVNGVKRGNIEILGDPSLRFQGSIQPSSYPIYLDIKLQKDNSWSDGENSGMQSQLSGYYVINSITHNLSRDGYTTSLNILSYPSLKKDLSSGS